VTLDERESEAMIPDASPGRSWREAGSAPRLVRRVAGVGLVVWGTLGLVHTTVVMVRAPHGWALEREPGSRALGIPLDGSAHVTETLDLLDAHLPPGEPVWIVRDGSLDVAFREYVQMQLAHLTYPRRVEMLPPPPGGEAVDGYGYAVTIHPATMGSGWTRVASGQWVSLYRREPS
jgi:hypothetical protein